MKNDSRQHSETRTIHESIMFQASPREVYEILMDSKKHQSLSGEKANISKKVGGKFTAWSGHISGINLVLEPGKKIVQAWRATGWQPEYYSVAIFDIQGERQFEATVYADRCALA